MTEPSSLKIQNISYRDFSNASKESKEKIFKFLNNETRKSEVVSIEEEYPSVFKSVPGGESLYIEDRGEIVAHVAFLEREFQHPLARMKVGLIGSVATHASYRGKGLATSLLRQASLELKRKGCLLAVLWSDQPEFYTPLGFQRAGREQDLKFTSKQQIDTGEIIRAFDFDKDAHLIWRLYQKQSCRLDRSLEEQKKLLRIPKVKVFVTEKEGGISSYIVINKGGDFLNFIHEWGGELSEVQRNISFCQEHFFSNSPLTLIAPGDYDISALNKISEKKWEGVLGLIKVLDKSRLLSTYMNFLKLKQVDHIWSKDKDSILFAETEFSVNEEKEVIQLVFGDEMAPTHPVMPFFLWGFDSI